LRGASQRGNPETERIASRFAFARERSGEYASGSRLAHDDAFAVVHADAPGIDVFCENRPVARADASGKAIVPSLNAYEPNRISIDRNELPLNSSIATTQQVQVHKIAAALSPTSGSGQGSSRQSSFLMAPMGTPRQSGERAERRRAAASLLATMGRLY